MPLPSLALAFIGDEVGPSLPEMISFCRENDLSRLDMRTVDGRNLLGMTLAEVETIAATLRKEGIEVPCFVSPVLKWAAPGKEQATGKVDFAFDPTTCPVADPLAPDCRERGPGKLVVSQRSLLSFGIFPLNASVRYAKICA